MYKHPVAFKFNALKNLVENRVTRRPLSITLELTRRCNARCDYCNHWKEQKQTEQEVADFVGVVEKFKPWAVTICGGEPFMRRDALEIIRAVKSAPGWRYVGIITNGWFLTDDRCDQLLATGIDQINISLNWPDERQDDDRKIKGLFKRIAHVVPMLVKKGANVQMNSIIMNDNLDDVVPIAKLAHSWGASVMYTLYSELPAENTGHLFPTERQGRLREVLAELKELRKTQKNIGNVQWYFDQIPSYVEGNVIAGCTAGKETLHISPGGMVRPCAELPMVSHFRDYDHIAAEPVTCTRCFQACRGEVQAPITLGRVMEIMTS
ncbi:MAG: radical SAM protein [Myxococcales bacterium]|nr:radical SAM protein [Myxococcales bacterium]